MYSLGIQSHMLTYYTQKDKSSQLMDFMHMDCHKKNYLISYYDHVNQEWILFDAIYKFQQEKP